MGDIEKVISSMRNLNTTGEVPSGIVKDVSSDMNKLLTSVNGVSLLKEHPKNLEVVLPCFIRLILHSDVDVAQTCLRHCDTILNILENKLPEIKKEGWWKKFEAGVLLDLIGSLSCKIEANDHSWVSIWTFLTNIVVTNGGETFHVRTLNKLLSVTQLAFQKGRSDVVTKDKALLCWKGLIDAFARSPNILVLNRAVDLLIRPLISLSSPTARQITTWVHLIEVMGLSGPDAVLNSIVQRMCEALFNSGEKSACRLLPDDCSNALITILSHDRVVQNCLSVIIEVFGSCISSRPSAHLIEQLAGVLVQAVNEMNDNGTSFKLWKALLEQCSGSPMPSVASQAIFTKVNFCRWIESSTIEGKEIAHLMSSQEFREKVLLRSIQALTFDSQAETPTKKKIKRTSYENVWSNYCEAYIFWWSNYSPASPKDNGKTDLIQSLIDSCDYQATEFLLLQPIQLNTWNPTVFKTWALLCEVCHKQKFLHTLVNSIFSAAENPNFQLRKAIDVCDCLYRLDNVFCKHSTKLLESISTFIPSMECQNLVDVLNLLETAVLFPEMFSIIHKVCKCANEKIGDFDQLDGHRVKTKVSKITRKLESLTNSGEKDKPAKIQRTPFRAQSNFLQRLAKAEEKNKTKSPYLTSIFSSAENAKTDLENNGDSHNDGASIVDTFHENGLITDIIAATGNAKPLDDSEKVPVITLPSVLKSSPVVENGCTEKIVAEKENVIISAINGAASPVAGSPKMKITNAREVKTVDASSPAGAKKSKPLAGQKSTPKKLAPAKVSYFDDDANDCVMVPPKPKTTPLTEHQMEIMSKRRTDIPALYQDLSQDTQSQQVQVVQEVTTGVSPRPIQESQDIVLGTPSPVDHAVVSAPDSAPDTEPLKPAGKSCTSAKKLDFNLLSTPPSKTSFMNDSFEEISPAPEAQLLKGKNHLEHVDQQLDQSKKTAPLSVISSSDILQTKSEDGEKLKGESQSGIDEKSKRKRKSEPSKFSPKLTRSKKNLKSATPDAKLTRMFEPDSKALLPLPSDPVDKVARPDSPEPKNRTSEGGSSISKTEDEKFVVQKKSLDDAPNHGTQEELPCQPAECGSPGSHNGPEQDAQGKPKKGRKRKIVNPSDNETPKKVKNASEDGSIAPKKTDSTKKKKKPFKLGSGGNLENWLVKVDRASTPATEQEVKKIEPLDETILATETDGPEAIPIEGVVVDFDNSEEIVPSTQEGLIQSHKPALPVLDTKVDEKCVDSGLAAEIKNDGPKVVVPDEANDFSPEKPEGSLLERLSHESPNDGDIALVISPSKRQRRAPSVFRGEGDTYLSKDKFYSAEPEEDTKASRVKKTASPTSKKRLQPLGGRSAKMLRLATNSNNQEDEDDIVVTPIRRRESIAPFKYGENWPKGPVEEWVACTPASPYISPFRSALKKTPGLEENTTPQRVRNDLMASPLLSSAKRKRVMFLDPPVTRGLAYETHSPGGSLHHADVPQGSPYPTWKGEDDQRRVQDDVKMECSPTKRDAARLNSLADLKADDVPEETINDDAALSKPFVSDEVRQLIDPSSATAVPTPEPNLDLIKEEFKLSQDFLAEFSGIDVQLRSLLVQCFSCANMAETVDNWKIVDCRRICQLPHSFLSSVKNSNGEILTNTLASSVFAAPSDKLPPEFSTSSVQTEKTALSETSSQTSSVSLASSDTQTSVKVRSVKTNTDVVTSCASTQADLTLPAVEDWRTLLKNTTPQEAFKYFSDSFRELASSFPKVE